MIMNFNVELRKGARLNLKAQNVFSMENQGVAKRLAPHTPHTGGLIQGKLYIDITYPAFAQPPQA
jgi:hypothetical protein